MLEKRGYGHMGGSLSIVELMSVLLWKAASIRCKRILIGKKEIWLYYQKDIPGPAWYSVLAEKGFLTENGYLH